MLEKVGLVYIVNVKTSVILEELNRACLAEDWVKAFSILDTIKDQLRELEVQKRAHKKLERYWCSMGHVSGQRGCALCEDLL